MLVPILVQSAAELILLGVECRGDRINIFFFSPELCGCLIRIQRSILVVQEFDYDWTEVVIPSMLEDKIRVLCEPIVPLGPSDRIYIVILVSRSDLR